MSFVAISALVAAFVAYLIKVLLDFRQHLKKYATCLAKIPGPEPRFFVGNALEFSSTTEVLGAFMRLTEEHGGLLKFRIGPGRFFLLVSDLKFLEFLLTSQEILTKSLDYRFLYNWLRTGLLTSTGKKWKQRRRIITPTFHFQILERFVEVFETNGNILIEKLEKVVEEEATDVYAYVTLLSLDIICESAMGTTVNAQNDSDSKYVRSVKEMCKILINRTFSPVKMSEILYHLTRDCYREKRAVRIMHDYTDSVIETRRRMLAEDGEKAEGEVEDEDGRKKRPVFLDMLLKTLVDGEPLSHLDVREEVDTFMFEGHDTTTSAVSFALFSLAKYPEVQRKVVEELREIFADDRSRQATHKDLQEMKYLEMVIKETLRLYPSVPFTGREIEKDTEYDGVVLPQGLTITIFNFGLHRNPKLWPEPERFDPERFTVENCTGRSPYAYIPFSAGPRNCIGQKFAMLEMKSVISKVVRNFELHPIVPAHELILAAETTLKSDSGMKIRFRKRVDF